MNDATAAKADEPPSSGTTIRAFYIDEFGNEHTGVFHCTMSPDEFQKKGRLIREAAEAFHAALGHQLLSLQQEVQHGTCVYRSPPPKAQPTHLRLAYSNGHQLLIGLAPQLIPGQEGVETSEADAAFGNC